MGTKNFKVLDINFLPVLRKFDFQISPNTISSTTYIVKQLFYSENSPGIRLAGPLSSNGIGRVEVLYNGEWGTICDSNWDMNDARVACRQLGYPYAFSALRGSKVQDDLGPIWLDGVECVGFEENLTSCYHRGWGDHYCDHSRDAGVECSSTGNIIIGCNEGCGGMFYVSTLLKK